MFYLDGAAALTVRLYGVSGKTVRLFAENNTVRFTELCEYTGEFASAGQALPAAA